MKDEWLSDVTGHNCAYWAERVQALIWQHVDDRAAVHPDTHVAGWVAALGEEVEQSLIIDRKRMDENILGSSVLAVILAAWAVRISHAKAHDPARPIAHRQRTAERSRRMLLAVVDAATDDIQDPVYFAGQRWEHPFAPGATDGSFV